MGYRLGVLGAMLALTVACQGGGGGEEPKTPLLQDLNADGQLIVIAFGDSITRGQGDGPGPRSFGSGYPARLGALLAADELAEPSEPPQPPAQIVNQGGPGERVTEGFDRLRSVLQSSQPDYVILLEGVNDIGDRTADRALGLLERMIDEVFADGAMPIVGTLTPACCAHEAKAPPSEIAHFNAALRAMAQANGIILIDFNAGFVVPPKTAFDPADGLLHVPDGLHPTPIGYDAMARTAIEALRAGPPLPPPT